MRQDYSRARHGDRAAEDGYVQEYSSPTGSSIRDTGCDELERFIRAQGVDMHDRVHNKVLVPALAIGAALLLVVAVVLLI